MDQGDRARRADQRLDAVLVGQLLQGRPVDMVQVVASPSGVGVEIRVQQAPSVGARNDHKRRSDWRAVVYENRRHDAIRFGHAVDLVPRWEILVPGPRRPAPEALLGIHAGLMEIDLVSQELADRVHQAGKPRQPFEGLGIGMCPESQSGGRGVILLPHHLRSLSAEHFWYRLLQRLRFLFVE